jgi:hypothetical protein
MNLLISTENTPKEEALIWPIETLQGIGKLFQANTQKSFNRFESIESLVKGIPENHLKSNEHIQKLVEKAFETCEFLSQMPEKLKEEQKN